MIPSTFKELMQAGGVIVGLKRCAERLEYSLGKLNDAGFKNITPHYGVDGWNESTQQILDDNGWKLLDAPIRNEPGAIGCTLTNLLLWKKVVNENLPYLMIFEDDVLPHPDIARIGEQFWRETPKDWDFLFMGNDMDCRVMDRVVSVPCFCTHAYIVSNAGARKAMDLIRDDPRGVDKVDCQLIVWMGHKKLTYYCWNGRSVPLPYPCMSHPWMTDKDVIRDGVEDGIFYQNLRFNSTIEPDRAAV